MDDRTPGQIAFEAYTAKRGGKNHDGSETPPWDKLGEDVQEGWEGAAAAAQTLDPHRTIAQLIAAASAQLEDFRREWGAAARADSGDWDGIVTDPATLNAAAREASLAITALEDAQMRATRGLALALDKFAPADLQL